MLLAKSNFYLDSCLILFFARARERPKWKWQYGDSKDRWYKYNQMWPSISNISRERLFGEKGPAARVPGASGDRPTRHSGRYWIYYTTGNKETGR
jgi:hypothetical protein